jgi:hypothetical protein
MGKKALGQLGWINAELTSFKLVWIDSQLTLT